MKEGYHYRIEVDCNGEKMSWVGDDQRRKKSTLRHILKLYDGVTIIVNETTVLSLTEEPLIPPSPVDSEKVGEL